MGGPPMDAAPTSATPKPGVPPWEITDSFPAVRAEAPDPPRGNGPSPAVPGAAGISGTPPGSTGSPRGGASFPTTPPETSGIPGEGASFPASPARPPGFPRDGASFLSSGETPSLFRKAPSSPSTPAEPAGFARGTGSFPAAPAETPGSPRAARPADSTEDAGENTETLPAVPPSGDGRLPRRIPLSERTGTYPPPGPPTDDDAFRLFPFGRNSDPSPGQHSED